MGSLLSRARLLRERPLYISGGLLRKARNLRGKTSEIPASDSGFIDPQRQKEQEIMAEMDSILGQNHLAITDETLRFSAQKTGARFPLMVNLGAAALMIILGTGLYFLFNRGEAVRADNSANISSTESRIISAVREESRKKLALKTEEINSIHRQLREAENARIALISETENELLRREAQLKESLSRELEAERQRLQAAGLNESDLNDQILRYQEAQQQEYNEQLAAVNAELEARLEERSTELNRRMEDYQKSLSSAVAEQELINAELSVTQQDADRVMNEVSIDSTSALARLEELNQQQRQVVLTEEYLLSMYDAVHTHLNTGEYQQAALQLDRLEDFINGPAAESVMTQNNRMQVELFLVNSLRRLINIDTLSREESAPIEPLLASVSAGIEEGNRLFDEGKLNEAQTVYSDALNMIPEIGTGYARLKEIEERQLAQERRLLEEYLAEADRLYQDTRYQASVEQYREALTILEKRAPSLEQLFSQLMDAGYYLRSDNQEQPEPLIITKVVREELSDDDRELIEKAQSMEARQRRLLDELKQIRTRFASGSSAEKSEGSTEALITLLNTKLLIRQALASTEVRKNYPDLYRTADAIFEAYGKEQHEAGKTEAFSNMVDITEYLRENPEAKVPLEESMNTRQRELLLQFLQNLEELLEDLPDEQPGQSSPEM